MFKCEYCGRDLLASIEDYDAWQLDHVVPTSKDGPDSFENLALCCKACNFMKLRYAPIGATRDERILDARRHIEERRARKTAELYRVRAIANYAPSK